MFEKITLLAAHNQHNVIGVDNKIPWHSSSDMKFFKEYTQNKVIVMGSKTFQSLDRFLYNRACFVLTSDDNKIIDHIKHISDNTKDTAKHETEPPFISTVSSYQDIIDQVTLLTNFFKLSNYGFGELAVVGGENVYKQFIDLATDAIVTVMKNDKSYINKKQVAYFPNIFQKHHWDHDVKPIDDKQISHRIYLKKQI